MPSLWTGFYKEKNELFVKHVHGSLMLQKSKDFTYVCKYCDFGGGRMNWLVDSFCAGPPVDPLLGEISRLTGQATTAKSGSVMCKGTF